MPLAGLDQVGRRTTAFAGIANESTRRSNHETIFGHLRSWWGVGRNGTLLDAATVLGVLTNECQPCSRSNGLTLTSLEDGSKQQAVVECLKSMRGLKQLRSGNYPIMAVSKNPREISSSPVGPYGMI